VLRAGVGAAVGFSGLRSVAAFAAGGPATLALGERLTLITGVGGNVLALRGDDGLLLVDSGAPAQVKKLQSTLKTLARGAPVRTVINTHWHLDQTGGNDVFARAPYSCAYQAQQRMSTPQYLPQDRPLPAPQGVTDHASDAGKRRPGADWYGYLLGRTPTASLRLVPQVCAVGRALRATGQAASSRAAWPAGASIRR
jgi:glyoxylase-like metal-dependent hydrolase (beta-lactamase superfamily II)